MSIPQIGRRYVAAQLALYGVVGALSLAADFIVFLVLLPVGLTVAVIVGFIVGTIANYLLSKLLAFTGGRFGRLHEIARLFVVALIGVGLTLGIVLMLVAVGLSPVMAKAVATVIVFAWNYLGRRLLVFHPHMPERSFTLASRSLARLGGVARGRDPNG